MCHVFLAGVGILLGGLIGQYVAMGIWYAYLRKLWQRGRRCAHGQTSSGHVA